MFLSRIQELKHYLFYLKVFFQVFIFVCFPIFGRSGKDCNRILVLLGKIGDPVRRGCHPKVPRGAHLWWGRRFYSFFPQKCSNSVINVIIILCLWDKPILWPYHSPLQNNIFSLFEKNWASVAFIQDIMKRWEYWNKHRYYAFATNLFHGNIILSPKK